MHQEVIVAGVAGVEIDAAGSVLEAVEASGLPTDASQEVGADFLSDAGLVQAVEIKQDWAIVLAGVVHALLGSPIGLNIEADAAVEDHVPADGGVQATLFRPDAIHVQSERTGSRRWSHERAKPKHGITLLGRGQVREGKERYNE